LHLCNDSVKGCALYEENIPLDMSTIKACDSFKIDPLTAAMNGGEDYELLFTIRQDDYEKLRKLEEVSIIGHITEASAGCNLITRSGQSVPITAQGWDGLKKFNRYNV
jgi:thiamine-monophosphate kinase